MKRLASRGRRAARRKLLMRNKLESNVARRLQCSARGTPFASLPVTVLCRDWGVRAHFSVTAVLRRYPMAGGRPKGLGWQ
jgi:hypothetical protein